MNTVKTPDAVAQRSPREAELTQMLGRTAVLWDQLIDSIERAHGSVKCEWHFGRTTGTWHVRLKQKARTILYLLPREKYFLTAFVFGERAEAAIRASDLPAMVVKALNEAPPCGAGRGIRLVTRSRRDVATMLKLTAIKLA
jgi:hypothetical protein